MEFANAFVLKVSHSLPLTAFLRFHLFNSEDTAGNSSYLGPVMLRLPRIEVERVRKHNIPFKFVSQDSNFVLNISL